MHRIKLLLISLVFFCSGLMAQETFIIEGDTLELTQEVKGKLSLYWTQQDHNYRFFVTKGKRMLELRNSNDTGGEFREQLRQLTADTDIKTKDVKFALYSLKHFVNSYNALVQEDYSYNASTSNIQYRLGLFVGLSNNKYTENPRNIMAPVMGVEFEFFDPHLAPRHVAFLQLRQSFKQDEYRYSSTQLSINYRFKALYFDGWDVHVDAELATFLYSEDRVEITNDSGQVTAIQHDEGFSFTAPFSFGIGSDIRLSENGFLSLSYNDIVSLVLDGNGNFPVDFSVGYKYNL